MTDARLPDENIEEPTVVPVKDESPEVAKVEVTKQYLGPDEVLGVAKEDFNRCFNEEVINVQLKNGDTNLMTKVAFDALVTSESTDENDILKRKLELVVPKVVEIIIRYDVKIYQQSALMQAVIANMADSMDRAAHHLWGLDDKDWVQGFNWSDMMSLVDVEKVLGGIKKDDVSK